MLIRGALALALLPAASLAEPGKEAGAASETCTYRTYAWSVKKRKGVGHTTVKKPRAELTDDERDAADPRCTVCREDQAWVQVEGAPKVRVCRHYADQVRAALEAVRAAGDFDLVSLKGYRPGRTRGRVVKGLRTQFSNHSYGTAIDINARQNGLYRRCKLKATPKSAEDIARCKLGVGGRWDPKKRPRTTITRGDSVHRAFTKFWKWGGELDGQLKDFMHFSVTGE